MQVVACRIDAPLVQPSKVRSGEIGHTGCGRAFFGDDADGFGFVQIRADAFYIGMDFLCPFLAFERADMVGNADDGGDFVAGKPSAPRYTSHCAVPSANPVSGAGRWTGTA